MYRSILFLIFFSCPATIYCQKTDQTNNIWISSGLGIFSGKTKDGLLFTNSVNWSKDKYISTGNKLKHIDFMMGIKLMNYSVVGDEDESGHRFYDLDLLVGTSFGNIFKISISGGIGLSRDYNMVPTYYANHPPDYHQVYYSKFIFPFEAGIYLVPSKYFGFGINVFTNLNSKEHIKGINLKLMGGKIR